MKRTIKSLFGYLGCICITLAVMYYIDGTAGIILAVALACAFVLSLFLTLVVRRFVTLDINVDKDLLVKGDKLICTVSLGNSIMIPTPLIEIEAGSTPHLKLDGGSVFKGSAAGSQKTEIKIPLTAVYSGAGAVTIKSASLTDYLGIFSFELKLPESLKRLDVGIYPDIPDAAVQTDFIRTAAAFSAEDDEEEETDEIAVGGSGMPGYEHRQYFPGDPIKKINWKLSSKRDIYMVRLDEKVCSAGQMFFLDAPLFEDSAYSLAVRDNVIEGALAVFSMIVREGREAAFFLFSDGLWQKYDIRNMGDIYALQEIFSSFRPAENNQLIPPDIISAGKTPICFTSAVSGNSGSAASIVSQSPDVLMISAELGRLNNISPNLWIVTNEFEFRKQGK